jgi:glycosyltransferase involved in cell wall biosynthesis
MKSELDEQTLSVTVIIPVFQRPDSVRAAIQSALEQTRPPLEIVVVDDASADETPDVVREIASRHPSVKLMVMDRNRGGGAARNCGILAAQGDLIAFLDSDDWWLPKKLEHNLRDVPAIRRAVGHDRWALCNFIRVLTPEGERLPGGRTGHITLPIDEYLFIEAGPLQTSSLILPAELARLVLFDDGLRRLQDWDFYLRLKLQNCQFWVQPEPNTIHDARRVAGRVSAVIDSRWLLQWWEQRRAWMTPRGSAGFLACKVAVEAAIASNVRVALWGLGRGLAQRAISPRQVVLTLAHIALPAGGVARVQELRRRFAAQRCETKSM